MVPEVWEITAPKLRPKELRQNSKRAYSRCGGHAKLSAKLVSSGWELVVRGQPWKRR